MNSADSSRIVVRPARPEEAAAVARTHVEADRETYEPIFGVKFRAVAMAQSIARWETAFVAGDVLLVAMDERRIVGMAHASERWMSALYLLASHHRLGIGRNLLSRLCEAQRARSVGEIRFQAVAENHKALAFYAAMGAREVGRKLEGEGDDAWMDVIFALATDAPALARR
jgi:GNAT superfamily N-acetyltransferase